MNFINKIAKRVNSDESGQGTLEFAFAAIILLTITFGIIDFSRVVYANSTIQAASQEAARAVIVNNDATDAAAARMFGLDSANAVVAVQNGTGGVEVTVSYEFNFITPLAGSLFGGSNGMLELTGVSNMLS